MKKIIFTIAGFLFIGCGVPNQCFKKDGELFCVIKVNNYISNDQTSTLTNKIIIDTKNDIKIDNVIIPTHIIFNSRDKIYEIFRNKFSLIQKKYDVFFYENNKNIIIVKDKE